MRGFSPQTGFSSKNRSAAKQKNVVTTPKTITFGRVESVRKQCRWHCFSIRVRSSRPITRPQVTNCPRPFQALGNLLRGAAFCGTSIPFAGKVSQGLPLRRKTDYKSCFHVSDRNFSPDCRCENQAAPGGKMMHTAGRNGAAVSGCCPQGAYSSSRRLRPTAFMARRNAETSSSETVPASVSLLRMFPG